MAKASDTLAKILGLVLLVGGAGLAFWGYQMSQSVVAQFSRAMTGALPDAVMYRYIGGAVAAAVGLFLLVKK
ncbi:MAG: DUF3185 family protein [Deltaproteobacteria bacterium]|nr:MAG: DUF3185 family protein [Deltaproteobacteria bacterium]